MGSQCKNAQDRHTLSPSSGDIDNDNEEEGEEASVKI